MQDYELEIGQFYFISTFEDTETGYSDPRHAKIFQTRKGVSSMGNDSIIYVTIDIDGSMDYLSERDFISIISDAYIKRMQEFWGCADEGNDKPKSEELSKGSWWENVK